MLYTQQPHKSNQNTRIHLIESLLGANIKNATSITGYGIDEHRMLRPNDGAKMNQAKHSTSAAGSTGTAAT